MIIAFTAAINEYENAAKVTLILLVHVSTFGFLLIVSRRTVRCLDAISQQCYFLFVSASCHTEYATALKAYRPIGGRGFKINKGMLINFQIPI